MSKRKPSQPKQASQHECNCHCHHKGRCAEDAACIAMYCKHCQPLPDKWEEESWVEELNEHISYGPECGKRHIHGDIEHFIRSLLSAERKRWLKSILPEEKHIPDDEVQVYGMDWELGVCSGWNDCIKTIKEKALKP